MNEHTPTLTMSLYFLVLGLGLGLVLQVLVIAVQNSVGYSDLGVATSGVTFFRSIGGSFGVAIFGAIFSNRLASELTARSAKVPCRRVSMWPSCMRARWAAPRRSNCRRRCASL